MVSIKKICFVDIPYNTKKVPDSALEIDFDKIYYEILKPAIESAGLESIRSDEEVHGGIIHQSMFARLLLAEYVIADLTISNPNVYYELGIRHAVKPFSTILIKGRINEKNSLPFDVFNNRSIGYDIQNDGHVSKESADKLKSDIKKRLDAIIKQGAQTDSPIFLEIKNYKGIELAHEITENFQERIKLESEFRNKLDEIKLANDSKENKLSSLKQIQFELGDLSNQTDSVLLSLFFAYRAVSGWNEMILLSEQFSPELKKSFMVQQQIGFALNRRKEPGDENKAILILNELRKNFGEDPETMGLLGRIYKDKYREEKKKNKDSQYLKPYLTNAIDIYTRGFKSDPRDYYPGINAVTLLIERGDEKSFKEAMSFLPSLNLAVARRGGLDSENYWDLATQLEIACIENDSVLTSQILDKIQFYITEDFMPVTTRDNIMLLKESLPQHYKNNEEYYTQINENLDRTINFLNGLIK